MTIRKWISLLVVFVPVLSFSTLIEGGKSDHVKDNDSLLLEEFQTARKNHIGIVDSRLAVKDNGERNKQREEGYWRYNVIPTQPVSVEEPAFDIQDHAGVNLIYVHGYNNTALDGILNGNKLWEQLTHANQGLTSHQAIKFFTFLWRGDFGKSRFSRSQSAANISAKSLLNFVETLFAKSPAAKTVLIAHSLGARVALEALQALSNKGKCLNNGSYVAFDSLVLIQGAVRALRLYHWKYYHNVQVFYTGPIDDPYRVYEDTLSLYGNYVDSLNCTHHLLYTFSERDNVLKGSIIPLEPGFITDEKFFLEEPFLPLLPSQSKPDLNYVALGNPFIKGEWKEPFGNLFDFFNELPKTNRKLSDPSNRYKVNYHGILRWWDWSIHCQCLIDELDVENYVKNPDEIIDIRWWHSPIYDDKGFPLVQKIWKQVTTRFTHSPPE